MVAAKGGGGSRASKSTQAAASSSHPVDESAMSALLTKENLYFGPGGGAKSGLTPAAARKLVEENLKKVDLENWVACERAALLEKRQNESTLEQQIVQLDITISDSMKKRECLRDVQRLITTKNGLRQQLDAVRENREINQFDLTVAPFLERWRHLLLQERNSQSEDRQRLALLQQRKREVFRQLLVKLQRETQAPLVVAADVCSNPQCRTPLIQAHHATERICPACQTSYPFEGSMPNSSAVTSFKDEQDTSPSGGYNKSSHQEDLLKKIQGKGSRVLEESMIEDFAFKLNASQPVRPEDLCILPKKEGEAVKPLKEGIELVRKTMKDLKLAKSLLTQIYCRLTGCPPPHVSPEREEVLRLLFRLIEKGPYQKWKAIFDPKRNNFMSYTYSTRKFLELLNWHDLIPWFPLLKGEGKLLKQELIWEGICSDMGWKYIPSLPCFARNANSLLRQSLTESESGGVTAATPNTKKKNAAPAVKATARSRGSVKRKSPASTAGPTEEPARQMMAEEKPFMVMPVPAEEAPSSPPKKRARTAASRKRKLSSNERSIDEMLMQVLSAEPIPARKKVRRSAAIKAE